MLRRLCAAALALAAFGAITSSASAKSGLFVTSATENGDGTVTLPLYHASSGGGGDVWLVLLDASSGAAADRLGVNRSSKLGNAGPNAVEHVDATLDDLVAGRAVIPATVDFTPVRQVVGDPATGFPPLVAVPGARGEAGYSPLIELRDGTVLNAPQIANASGQADKVVRLDTAGRRVVYRETNGFQGGRAVRYVSTDASDEAAARARGRDVRAGPERGPVARRGRHRRRADEPRRVRQRPDRRRQPGSPGPELGASSTGSTR